MLTAADLADAARTGAGLPSFYALARLLDVSDNTVSNWRHGRATPDDLTAVRLAEMAGLDAPLVLAAMHAQRCTDSRVRSAWQALAARAAAAAACVILSLAAWHADDTQTRASAGLFALAALALRHRDRLIIVTV
ncbi:MAG: hypothetical protein RIQ53_3090 [Pseudomonadota bacterium]|jgi:transcriptional regulator with XRE-family HTH domain